MMLRFSLLAGLALGCATEVASAPTPPCEQPIIDGPVDSSVALALAECTLEPDLPLLSLDATGTGPEAAAGRFDTIDLVFLGPEVVHAVGLAEGLRPGSAEYGYEQIFGSTGCTAPVPRPASSAEVVPHALSAGLGPLGDGEVISYRIASDCLTEGTAGRILVATSSGDRLIYSAEGELVEPCLACAPSDPRPCCSL